MRGDLRQSSLAEVVRHLYAERRNGILHVSRQGIRRRIHFKQGVAIFADSGDHELQSREQAELLAYSLFTWTSGEFEFEDGGPNIAESVAFEGSPSTLILDGIRRIDELEILEQLVGGRDTIFGCTQTSVLPRLEMKLSLTEDAILTFARDREQFTAEELPLPSGDLSVFNALNALVAVGLLEIVNNTTAPGPVQESVPVVEATAAATPPPTPAPPLSVASAPAPVAPSVPAPRDQETVTPPPEQTPPVAPIMPTVPSEMEQLFDTLESKRSGSARPKPAPSAPAAPQPTPAPPEEPLLEATLADAELILPEPPVGVPAPTPPPHPADATVPIAADAVPPIYDPSTAAEVPAPTSARPPAAQPPRMQNSAARPSRSRPSVMAVIGGAMVMAIIVVLVVMLTSGDEETTSPDAAVAADPAPPVEASPPVQPPPTPTPTPPEPEPKPEPPRPTGPTPNQLYVDARAALNRGELEASQAKLDELKSLDATFPGAEQLQDDLANRFWEKTLPLAFNSRHDHALGGCDGVLSLTSLGYGYRSDKHEWFWSFGDVAETERKDSRRLRIETTKGRSYNFELSDPLVSNDWTRFQQLKSR